jgi:hypothetical protein
MAPKASTGKTKKKLDLRKETVKDLDVRPDTTRNVKGGATYTCDGGSYNKSK